MRGLPIIKGKKISWETAAGDIVTNGKCELKFTLPEFTSSREIKHKINATSKPVSSNYDAIIGRDLMYTLGIDVRYSSSTVHWTDQGEIPMKNNVSENENLFFAEDPK